MRTFEVSIFVKRPQQDIFAFATNPDNDPLWLKDHVSSEWITPEPVGVGSTKRTVLKFMGRHTSLTVAYTIWEPPNMYGVKFNLGPILAQATTKFEPEEGGTRVTLTGRGEAPGILKLVEGLVTKQAEAQNGKDLETLKLVMEHAR